MPISSLCCRGELVQVHGCYERLTLGHVALAWRFSLKLVRISVPASHSDSSASDPSSIDDTYVAPEHVLSLKFLLDATTELQVGLISRMRSVAP